MTYDDEIYLDNNSSTPIDPEVLAAMLPWLSERWGNAANTTHDFGTNAAKAVEKARSQVANLIGADATDILFTSGATESNNLAILGLVRPNLTKLNRVITTQIEHSAVLEPCRQLEREGANLVCLPVSRQGVLDLSTVAGAIIENTVLVSVMMANNEIGTLQPIREIAEICHERGVVFHTDAAQAAGRIPINVDALGVDLLSLSGHKMYGPQGVGALFIRGSAAQLVKPLFFGGGQQRGLRPGTIPVSQVVAIGAAAELASKNIHSEQIRLGVLRERLLSGIRREVPRVIINGNLPASLPGLLSISFPELDGDVLIYSIKGVALSQGSSCASGSFAPSHVLRAIGFDDQLSRATLRMGIGRFTTAEEIDVAVARIVAVLRKMYAGN